MKLSRILSVIVLAAAASGARAEDAAPKVSQEADVFVQHTWFNDSRPAYKFEEYRSMPNGLVMERYALDVNYVDYRMSFEALHVNQLDQSYKAEGGTPGVFRYKVSYDQTPHQYSTHAKTPWVNKGNGYLALPDGLQQDMEKDAGRYLAVSTGMASFLNGSPDVSPLRVDIAKTGVDLSIRPDPKWVIGITGTRTTKLGARPMGTEFSTGQSNELAVPIDNVSYEGSVGADYAAKMFQAGVHYDFSKFQNNLETLIWDNPKRFTDSDTASTKASAMGRLAMDPSNYANTLRANAGLDLPYKIRFSGEVGYTVMTQDEAMLPYTINTALKTGALATGGTVPFNAYDPANLPGKTVDAKMVAINQSYRVSTRGTGDVRASAGFRSYKLENRSKEYSFPGSSPTDQSWAVGISSTARFGYKKENADVKVDYDLLRSLSVGAGAGIEWRELEDREVPKTKENQYTGSVVFRPANNLFFNLSGLTARRRMEEDVELADYKSPAGVFTEMPGLRRYDVADRNRKQGRVQMQVTSDSDMDLTLSSLVTKDRYVKDGTDFKGGVGTNQDKLYGMTSQSDQAHGIDVSLPLGGTLTTDLYYEYDLSRRYIESNTNSTAVASQDAANDWTMRTIETSNIGGITFNWKPGKFSGTVGYDRVHSNLDSRPIRQGSALALLQLPDTKRDLQTYTLRGAYKITENLSVLARYSFELFTVTDFATDDVPLLAANLPGSDAIYMGNSIKDYTAHTIGLGLNYSF